MNLFTIQKQIQWLRKQSSSYQGDGGEGGYLGIDMYILLYIKIDNQQGPTV